MALALQSLIIIIIIIIFTEFLFFDNHIVFSNKFWFLTLSELKVQILSNKIIFLSVPSSSVYNKYLKPDILKNLRDPRYPFVLLK
jgi:hypothetical protein